MLKMQTDLYLPKILLSLIMPREEFDKSVWDTSWPKGNEAVGSERNRILVICCTNSFIYLLIILWK